MQILPGLTYKMQFLPLIKILLADFLPRYDPENHPFIKRNYNNENQKSIINYFSHIYILMA